MLALVVTDITNPYFTLMAKGVEDVAGDNNYTVVFCNTDESETEEEKYVNILAQRQVDGVLLVPACGNVKTIKFLLSNNINVVVLDRRVPEMEIDFVGSGSDDGAYRLIKLLIGMGHERIAVITGSRMSPLRLIAWLDIKRHLQVWIDRKQTRSYGEFTSRVVMNLLIKR